MVAIKVLQVPTSCHRVLWLGPGQAAEEQQLITVSADWGLSDSSTRQGHWGQKEAIDR